MLQCSAVSTTPLIKNPTPRFAREFPSRSIPCLGTLFLVWRVIEISVPSAKFKYRFVRKRNGMDPFLNSAVLSNTIRLINFAFILLMKLTQVLLTHTSVSKTKI